jgi:hypothetical protein
MTISWLVGELSSDRLFSSAFFIIDFACVYSFQTINPTIVDALLS